MLIVILLVFNISANHLLIQPNRIDTVTARPEVLACKAFVISQQRAMDLGRGFILQITHDHRHTILRGNAQHHVDMNRYGMAF